MSVSPARHQPSSWREIGLLAPFDWIELAETVAPSIAATRLDTDPAGLSAHTRGVLRLFDWFDAFETRHRTEEWRFEDLHLWPIAKYLSVTTLYRSDRDPRGLARTLAKFELYSTFRRWLAPLRRAVAADVLPGTESEGTSVFLGNATTLREMGGLRVQLNYDYLRTALEARGQQTRSLIAGMSDTELGEAPNLYPHASLGRAMESIRGNASVRAIFDDQPGIGELLEFLGDLVRIRRRRGLLAYLNVQASRVLEAAALWEARFRGSRPVAAYCYNYGGPFGWGLALACRRLAIPCYEIQHGVQGPFHGAYHWTRTPAEGWTCVPPGRLVWSSVEPRFVEAASVAHVTGPGSLQTIAMILNARTGPLEQLRVRMIGDAAPLWRELSARSRPRVLFCAQNPGDVDLLARLASDRTHDYFFRAHPRHLLQPSADRSELLSASMADACTRLPLPLVMAGVDAIVSHYSSTFIEGRYFGLPCVALSDYVRTLQHSYGRDDLVASSIDRCAADLSALELRPASASPEERLERMSTALPDLDRVVESLPL